MEFTCSTSSHLAKGARRPMNRRSRCCANWHRQTSTADQGADALRLPVLLKFLMLSPNGDEALATVLADAVVAGCFRPVRTRRVGPCRRILRSRAPTANDL